MSTQRRVTQVAIAKPLYTQVRDILADRILDGEWSNGRSLPNEARLAAEFGVSIGTVRRAVENLEDLGVVERRQGRGTYVTLTADHSSANTRLLRLRSVSGKPIELMKTLVSVTVRDIDPITERRLLLLPKSSVFQIDYVLTLDGQELGVEEILVPKNFEPDLICKLEGGHNLDEVLRRKGFIPVKTHDFISFEWAAGAGAQTESQLVPIMRIERILFALNDQPVEVSLMRLRAAALKYESIVN